MSKRLWIASLLLSLCACPKKPGSGAPAVTRCELDLVASGLFKQEGTGAVARRIEDAADLFGGQSAVGQVGDYLLENDRIRLVIDQPGRIVGLVPYGGNIVDADVVRTAGEPGGDQLGKLGLLYAFGRTLDVSNVEVLSDGSAGGPAVIAATGLDTVSDYINAKHAIRQYLGSDLSLVFDVDAPLPLRATTYYVLSPGEQRVRIATAFCNTGDTAVSIPMGEAFEQGGSTDLLNPSNCEGRMGAGSCLADPAPWFGFQGDRVAYGHRSYKLDDPTAPAVDTLGSQSTFCLTVADTGNLQGALAWFDAEAHKRPGTLLVKPGASRLFLRDLVVAPHLGDVTSVFLNADGLPHGHLEVTAQQPDGNSPAPQTRVAVLRAADDHVETLLVTDTAGKAAVDLAPGNYRVLAGGQGRSLETRTDVAIADGASAQATARLGAARTLTVTVKDANGAPMPAKLMLLCPAGTCPTPRAGYRFFENIEPLPDDIFAIELVPAQGSLDLLVPPGEYSLVVTRGPEYSVWPDTWPQHGQAVDLRTADVRVDAVLGQVVDTVGWMSADLHVHAVNSSDSSVRNERRVLGFAAEGVDVLCSTDHDYITDYAPVIRALGAEAFLTSIQGQEITSFDFGHWNAYPLDRTEESENGGAFDWAGGPGATLRPAQIFAGVKARWPDAFVQINHPRSSLTPLKVDTATGASHADPAEFRMEPDPEATAADSRLFSEAFDGYEVQNGPLPARAVMNDWMTFLSRGLVKTATAVSDTHSPSFDLGGYGRTYVDMGGRDTPAQFDRAVFAASLKAHKATCSNGPFLAVSARRLDSTGAPAGAAIGLGQTLSINAAGGEAVELTVDVQAPEWMLFDTLEVYTHADGRESAAGVDNSDWPDSRILQVRHLDAATLPLEVASTAGGATFRRIHVREKLTVTPTKDAWYVVQVRGSNAMPPIFPLVTSRGERANAFSNALFVDADGSGAYDDFPLKVPRSLPLPPRPPPPAPVASRRVPTLDQVKAGLRRMQHHR